MYLFASQAGISKDDIDEDTAGLSGVSRYVLESQARFEDSFQKVDAASSGLIDSCSDASTGLAKKAGVGKSEYVKTELSWKLGFLKSRRIRNI